jgi:hypothetical protein
MVGQHTTVNTFPGLVQNKCAWQRIGLSGVNPLLIAEDRASLVTECLKDPILRMVVFTINRRYDSTLCT